MSCTPFPFFSTLPITNSELLCISKIQLFSDSLQRIILARGNFSLESYQLSDFTSLGVDLPKSIEDAVVKRQAEYLCGRYLSRLAMQQSGLFFPYLPQLATGPLRAPAWPDLVTGSITHHKYNASAVVLTQPLARDNFVGIDSELWLTFRQAREVSMSIHNKEELRILLRAGFTDAQATTLLFSAKEALFKAICPFVGEYFSFEAARLQFCSDFVGVDVISGFIGSMQLQLTNDGVASKAPQQNYKCWFNCSEHEVLTLVCSDNLASSL